MKTKKKKQRNELYTSLSLRKKSRLEGDTACLHPEKIDQKEIASPPVLVPSTVSIRMNPETPFKKMRKKKERDAACRHHEKNGSKEIASPPVIDSSTISIRIRLETPFKKLRK